MHGFYIKSVTLYEPEAPAIRGRNPSSLVKSCFGSFEVPCPSLELDFRFRAAAGFLALCISLQFEPLEHLPVRENSSHSRMCFLSHYENKEKKKPASMNSLANSLVIRTVDVKQVSESFVI